MGVTAIHQGRSRTPVMHTRQDEKSFRTGDRDERSNKDACPLRGLRERGQKDVRVLARLVRTQPQSLIRDPLSCHRIMRRACRHGMGAHTGRNGRSGWAHTACKHGSHEPSSSIKGCALLMEAPLPIGRNHDPRAHTSGRQLQATSTMCKAKIRGPARSEFKQERR